MDTDNLHTEESGAEHGLGAAETLVADGDDLTIGQLVRLLNGGGGGGGGHLLLEVESDVAKLLLQVAACQVQTEDGVGESVTLIDGDGVGDTISDVGDKTGGTTRGVQGEDGLDAHISGWGVEGLKDDLDKLLSVGLGVEGGLRVEMRRLVGRDSQLVVEGVVPDLLHVVPGGEYTVLNGVFQGEDTSLGLSLVTDVGVLVAHTDHDGDMARTANDGGEDGAGSVISGESTLDHSGAIVNDQSCGFLVVTHGCGFCWGC